LSAAELLSISQDYTGLGETGETMIVAREPEGVRVLHPVRHPGLVGGSWIPERGSAVDPAAVAADGRTARLLTNVTDYRGEAVWAATRFLPDTRWGVVVKVDAAEEQIPIDELRDRVVRLALALSAFAILGGILLGLQLTRPIQELVRAANLILAGETDARAQVRTHDEVGLLARVFNRMADALTARDVSIGDDDLAIEVEAARERLAQETAEAAMMSEDRSSSTGF
jgi:HAMP domain-containing protein